MTIEQINIILLLESIPKFQKKWGEANDKWKKEWVDEQQWEDIRESMKQHLDEALANEDRVFFSKVKSILQKLLPWKDDIEKSNPYKAVKQIEEYIKKYNIIWGEEEPQQEQLTLKPQQGLEGIPIELDTDKGRDLLKRTIEHGFCNESYKWLKTKALLAYYGDKASEYLRIGKGLYDGREKTNWKPFEALFRDKDGGGISNLSQSRNDYRKTGELPIGHADIDNLFEELQIIEQ